MWVVGRWAHHPADVSRLRHYRFDTVAEPNWNGSGDLQLLEVSIPGQTNYLEVLRGVAARAGHIARFTYDGVEDLALAMTETASIVMRSDPRRVEAKLVIETDHVEVETRGIDPNEEWPTPGMVTHTSWQILLALCDELSLLDNGVAFRQLRR